jgi:hypothetical protein
MKRFLLLFIISVSGTCLSAQKTINDANTEKRPIGSFHGLEVSTGITLILTEGTSEEVAVSASKPEYRDKIVTRVDNGILKIYYENKLNLDSKKEKKELRAYVSYKALDEITVNTGAELEIDGTLKSKVLTIHVNTGGTLQGTIAATDLKVDQNTGSVVTISGETNTLDIHGDTGSMFKGIDLKTGNCTATVTTGAGIYITVLKELNVKANTGGYLKYKGPAVIIDVKNNTGGSVRRIDSSI